MTAPRIAAEIQALARLDLGALRDDWRRRWGEPPLLRSRDLMARAMTHKIQTAALGDLAAPLRRRMNDYAGRFSNDRTFTPDPGVTLPVGSSIIREWHGVRHEVTITEAGFSYRGEPFGSLSQVARKITGVKWNGPVFFGVKPKGGK